MTYLLANGDSLTAKNFNSTYKFTSSEDKKNAGIPLEGEFKMWPEYVADKLELPSVNLGKNGATNQRIYRTTAEQVELKKPKVIMHQYAVGYCHNFHNMKLWDHTHIISLELANHLLEHNSEAIISIGTSKSWFNYRLAFLLINHYYPEKYEKCKDFYISLCNNNDMHPIENIITDGFWWVERGSSFLFCAWYLDLYQSSDEVLQEKLKYRIDEQLEPILRSYELCKKEEIPSIAIIEYTMTDGRQVLTHHLETEDINVTDPNLFQSMLLGAEKAIKYMTSSWTYNYYFKKIEKLVSDNKYVLHNWPSIPHTPREKPCGSWLEGWKNISDHDYHPHPDTQKLIGDFFYNSYIEKYGEV